MRRDIEVRRVKIYRMTMAFQVTVSITVAVLILFLRDKDDSSKKTASQKLSDLNQISKSLSSVEAFIVDQKKAVQDEARVLNDLQSQRQQLEPVIKTERTTIDAILSAHDSRQFNSIWLERLYGFLAGIVGSLIAGALPEYLRKFRMPASADKPEPDVNHDQGGSGD